MDGDGSPAAVLLGLDGFTVLTVEEVVGEIELLVETARRWWAVRSAAWWQC